MGKAPKAPTLYNVIRYKCTISEVTGKSIKIKQATLDYGKPYPLAKWLANGYNQDKSQPKGTIHLPTKQ